MQLPIGLAPIYAALATSDGEQIMQLAGYDPLPQSFRACQHVPLLLTWQALVDIQQNWSLSLHVLDEQWNQVWARDIAALVVGMCPASHWVSDEVVQDYH